MDRLIGGFQESDLVITGWRPSVPILYRGYKSRTVKVVSAVANDKSIGYVVNGRIWRKR